MRSDFLYEGDDPAEDGIWCIYPEFEDSAGKIVDENDSVKEEGTATMWILFQENRDYHRHRLNQGSRGYMVSGTRKIAEVEVLEILALHD